MFSNDEIASVIRAENKREQIANSLVHLPNGKVKVTAEFDSIVFLKTLLRTTQRIVHSNDVVSVCLSSGGRKSYRFTRLGRKLHDACQQYRDKYYVWEGSALVPRYRSHKFNPYLEVALREIDGIEDAIIGMPMPQLHYTIATLARSVREQCNTREFKTRVRNYKRKSQANFARALRYLCSLFRKCSRLLVLRVDLYVREENMAWSYTPQADAAFDKFSEALRTGKIVPDVLGWMAAREDGPERGQHYHCLVVLDGHLHWAGANLTKMLGEYWKNECVPPDKAGSYFNCFSLEKEYKHLGIGLVHCTDAKKLLGLFYAARYLFKSEVLMIATGQRTRNFRRGIMRQETETTTGSARRGAPRAQGDDLSVVRRVFFGEWTHTAQQWLDLE